MGFDVEPQAVGAGQPGDLGDMFLAQTRAFRDVEAFRSMPPGCRARRRPTRPPAAGGSDPLRPHLGLDETGRGEQRAADLRATQVLPLASRPFRGRCDSASLESGEEHVRHRPEGVRAVTGVEDPPARPGDARPFPQRAGHVGEETDTEAAERMVEVARSELEGSGVHRVDIDLSEPQMAQLLPGGRACLRRCRRRRPVRPGPPPARPRASPRPCRRRRPGSSRRPPGRGARPAGRRKRERTEAPPDRTSTQAGRSGLRSRREVRRHRALRVIGGQLSDL